MILAVEGDSDLTGRGSVSPGACIIHPPVRRDHMLISLSMVGVKTFVWFWVTFLLAKAYLLLVVDDALQFGVILFDLPLLLKQQQQQQYATDRSDGWLCRPAVRFRSMRADSPEGRKSQRSVRGMVYILLSEGARGK